MPKAIAEINASANKRLVSDTLAVMSLESVRQLVEEMEGVIVKRAK